MSCDAQNAFLFQCGDEQLFAVSLDKTGVNLPRNTCTQGWLLREKFLLGVQEPVPAAISPDPILRGIDDKGYYIWRSGNAKKPTFPLKTRATSSDRDRVAGQLRTSLQNMAAAGLTITYDGLAKLLGLSPPNTIQQITVALERLMEEDAEAGRPFIAALALSKTRRGLPAAGFFDRARRLGRFTGDPNGVEARSFHATELNAAQKFWGERAASCRDQ